tara:strand:- start:6042 stop:7871 length:1830 start_codon:yes stop_codon:yes gene_type:complete
LKTLLKLLIFGIFLFVYVNGFSQNIDILKQYEKISIKKDSSFTNEILIKFKKNEDYRIYPIFYDSELENISKIMLFSKKGRREKPFKNVQIYEEDVELDYISSQKVKTVEIPKEKEVYLRYEINCKELIYFSSLPFFSYNNIDSLEYKIEVPKKFELAHKTILRDSLSFYSIDSVVNENASIWKIKSVPKKVQHDPLQYFGIYKNMSVPIMKTIVVPAVNKYEPLKYMNDWYLKNLNTKRSLSNAAKSKIDELTSGIQNKEQIVKIIYNYVKSNFKYVAIEVGMGAFIPSHVNEVFTNKQGDCKDLSNFLTEALKYKGIKSDVALAATFDHISDCDFPSLSSANHVISIAYFNDAEVLLDPTDPIHQQKTPVQSLQERTILIVNDNGGKFLKAKNFTSTQNEIDYQIKLNLNTEKSLLDGDFNVSYKGIADNNLQRIYSYETEKSFNNFIDSFFKEIFGNQEISNLTKTNTSHNFNFKGSIKINGKTFNDNNNTFLFLDFAPKLFENESRDNLLEGTYIQNPFGKKVIIEITLTEPIEIFSPKKHSFKENGVSLNLVIKSVTESKLIVSYDFLYDHIFVDKTNVNATNNILKSFKKIINEPIILKRKKI